MLDLDVIKARLEKATPGPWNREDRTVYVLHGDGKRIRNRFWAAVQSGSYSTDASEAECVATADLIAHAPEDVAQLVAEVERLRGKMVICPDCDRPVSVAGYEQHFRDHRIPLRSTTDRA